MAAENRDGGVADSLPLSDHHIYMCTRIHRAAVVSVVGTTIVVATLTSLIIHMGIRIRVIVLAYIRMSILEFAPTHLRVHMYIFLLLSFASFFLRLLFCYILITRVLTRIVIVFTAVILAVIVITICIVTTAFPLSVTGAGHTISGVVGINVIRLFSHVGMYDPVLGLPDELLQLCTQLFQPSQGDSRLRCTV